MLRATLLGLLTLTGPGCMIPFVPGHMDPVSSEVRRSSDRVLVQGQVSYACLVGRPAGAGVPVVMTRPDGSPVASTETGTDGRFVIASPFGLSEDDEVVIRAGDGSAFRIKVVFNGHYTARLATSCPAEAGRPPRHEAPAGRAVNSVPSTLNLALPDADERPVPH